MSGWRHIKALKRQTVKNRLNIIIGLVILILLFGLANFWFGMRVMSGIRAYVGGEGLWSKAQKESVSHLVRYTQSHDEADYQKFLEFTQVQLGDKQARLELDKPNFDREIVREGFIKGGNHPDDVNDLIFLYRRFRNVSYMKSAIQTWTEGDREIENLLSTGNQIHTLIANTPAPADQAQRPDPRLAALVQEVYAIDARLTVLENQFSATLNEGARGITSLLLRLTLLITFILGVLSISVASMFARAIIRLDRLKSDFVSLASHQLRTPLTAMNWSSEALLFGKNSDNLTPVQKKYIHGMYTGGQRLSSLIDGLLRVSSLDLEKYEPDETDVDLRHVVATVIKDQQKVIAEKNLTITTDIDTDLPTLRLDKHFVTNVLQNLVSNSVKYTNSGGQITVSAKQKKGHVIITVSDTGIGIPTAQQSQVFSKIFRADNAKKITSIDGTGLGLYIAKVMVKRLKGTIWFDSTENRGTNFYVKLPIKRR